ncbi:exopolysaccharide biosynthesis protein [Rhizobium lemnae]|uniref:Exopolysaccharide biosynthesis protein n=1 Tax=Rhizobium lemnae TaxID=1214924 RepID=A0ABV8ECJ0_9HYPH|nr:exopolysaccharide biosynthesis protein [Rhizobium lemnae]MCJ8507041.1 exopolysaccharide biosynthesis protein [Rhizobium lemnae]
MADNTAAMKGSDYLLELLETAKRNDGLHIRTVLLREGRLGVAIALLMLAIPAVVPIPNPLGPVFGTCLAFVAVQMLFGRQSLWLPEFIGRRMLPMKVVAAAVNGTRPTILKIEARLRPGRLSKLTGRGARVLLAVPVLFLAVLIALPIPFGNTLPAISIVLIAISLAEQDGLMILLAMVVLVAACFACYYLAITAGSLVFTALF